MMYFFYVLTQYQRSSKGGKTYERYIVGQLRPGQVGVLHQH